jgi:hypothetical protein
LYNKGSLILEAVGTFHRHQGGIGRGYRTPDIRGGQVGMHIRDQEECKEAKIPGSISSTPMTSPLSNPARMRGRDVSQAGMHRQRV